MTIAVKDTCPRGNSQGNSASQRCEAEITAGLLDRLLHRGVVVAIDGPSYRMRAHQQRTEQLRNAITAGKP